MDTRVVAAEIDVDLTGAEQWDQWPRRDWRQHRQSRPYQTLQPKSLRIHCGWVWAVVEEETATSKGKIGSRIVWGTVWLCQLELVKE